MALHLANSTERFGVVSLALHWVMALLVFALFALGLYMTGLDYTDAWYRSAPEFHKSFGMALFVLAILRVGWRLGTVTPALVPMPKWESIVALEVHRLFYILLLLIPISGYLISTADGRGIEFFGLFEVPALISSIDKQEDVAGAVHLYLALFVIGLAGLHTLAALKHHFVDKDATLKRIFGG
ncbi:MAG: cytochrome b [Proteobacteria bacterium]|nr:cytochrome b [Pseudomonadota bacterium]